MIFDPDDVAVEPMFPAGTRVIDDDESDQFPVNEEPSAPAKGDAKALAAGVLAEKQDPHEATLQAEALAAAGDAGDIEPTYGDMTPMPDEDGGDEG